MAAERKRGAKVKAPPKPKPPPRAEAVPVAGNGELIPVDDDKQLAAYINAEHGAALQAGQASLDFAHLFLIHSRNAGSGLLKIQAKKDRSFQAWVKDHCNFSVRTAYRYIDAAQEKSIETPVCATVAQMTPQKVSAFTSAEPAGEEPESPHDGAEAAPDGESDAETVAPEAEQAKDPPDAPAAEAPPASPPAPSPETPPAGEESPAVPEAGVDAPAPPGQTVEGGGGTAAPAPEAPQAVAEELPPQPEVPKGRTYPHSERLRLWVERVQGETLKITMDLGGIRTMLAERDRWHWGDVRSYILPMLDDMAAVLDEFRKEIADACQQP
jgi:hypothetical protein